MNYNNKLENIWLYLMCICSINEDLVFVVVIRNEYFLEKIYGDRKMIILYEFMV